MAPVIFDFCSTMLHLVLGWWPVKCGKLLGSLVSFSIPLLPVTLLLKQFEAIFISLATMCLRAHWDICLLSNSNDKQQKVWKHKRRISKATKWLCLIFNLFWIHESVFNLPTLKGTCLSYSEQGKKRGGGKEEGSGGW